jgi:hypothetical protein
MSVVFNKITKQYYSQIIARNNGGTFGWTQDIEQAHRFKTPWNAAAFMEQHLHEDQANLVVKDYEPRP